MIRGKGCSWTRVARWAVLAGAAPALWACTSRTLETPTPLPTATLPMRYTQKVNNNLDILFMIDNSSSMQSMQEKLYEQLPTFMNILTNTKTPPNLHVAVISSDLGAPGDATASDSCTAAGDMGVFQNTARSDSTINATCVDTTLQDGAYFISDVKGMPNFTNPMGIGAVFQCIALLGQKGCGFEHQLASIDRALGSDQPQGMNPDKTVIPSPPSQNVGFLRPDAYLGIVILTNEDDCSAPANTGLFSLGDSGNGSNNLENPTGLGPLANYRCNQYGHLCKDPASSNPDAYIALPQRPPADAQGSATAPTLDLADCKDNDQGTGMLTPVARFVSDIKALKPDPDNQILVAAIAAPATPYTIQWVPPMPGQASPGTPAGELWPQVEHSCGPSGQSTVNPETTMYTTDMSFGDPGVRIGQFVGSFQNSVLSSICLPDYSSSLLEIANKLNALIQPPCITEKIQTDAHGQPACSVIENLTDSNQVTTQVAIPNCNENGNVAPCWTMATPDAGSTCAGQELQVNDTQANMMAADENATIDCSICLPGVPGSGC
ncbi:MAG TPA: hypothetical protein VHG72_00670 [Polyangia bacterium]|nr:hypothetical protein [Polyangia bacterium]